MKPIFYPTVISITATAICSPPRTGPLKVTFHLKGKSPLHRDRYPYEAIFYPLDRAGDTVLKVTIEDIDSGKKKSVEVPVGH